MLRFDCIRCRKLTCSMDIGWGCRCAMSWCDFNLSLDLAIVTLTFKILPGLYLGNMSCRKLTLGRDFGWGESGD